MRSLSRSFRRPAPSRPTLRARPIVGGRDIAHRFARAGAWNLNAEAGAMADALAEARILETLAEPETRLIRFSLGQARVDRPVLDRVATALRDGTIQAVALRPDTRGMGPALFSPRLDAFCLQDPLCWTLAKRAAVLGQAVQAGLHLAGAPADHPLREAAGDVAAAIRIALDAAAPETDPALLAGRRAQAAMRIALRVVRDGDADLAPDDPDCLELREALQAPPGRMRDMARILGAMG